jgi:HPt (histidine-containing phosphotransfer) domain-containing protein
MPFTDMRAADVDERVDEEALAELFLLHEGTGADLPRLLESFVRETSTRIEVLERAVRAGDFSGAGRAAHGMRGASRAFGARRLVALGEQAEQACSAGDAPATMALLPALRSESKAFHALTYERVAAAGAAA